MTIYTNKGVVPKERPTLSEWMRKNKVGCYNVSIDQGVSLAIEHEQRKTDQAIKTRMLRLLTDPNRGKEAFILYFNGNFVDVFPTEEELDEWIDIIVSSDGVDRKEFTRTKVPLRESISII